MYNEELLSCSLVELSSPLALPVPFAMEDFPLQKIAISGPTLASILQRILSSLGDVDGLLFGHVAQITPALSDDSPSPLTQSDSSDSPSELVANITSFLCPSSPPLSFYGPLGRVDLPTLRRFLSASAHRRDDSLLGWFSGRRRTPLRPSMREFAVTRSLSASHEAAPGPPPHIFLLFSTPLHDQLIHTHEYRAYQLRSSGAALDPRPIDVVNVGPAFRGHYGNFSPWSGFPALRCELRGSMNVDRSEGRLSEMRRAARDQSELDSYAEGFRVADLGRLMGSEASNHTAGLEDLYEKMLAKIDHLAKQVEISNAQLVEQENQNRKLRYKVGRSGVE